MGAVFDEFCNDGICIVDIEINIVSIAPIGSERKSTSLVSVEFARLHFYGNVNFICFGICGGFNTKLC